MKTRQAAEEVRLNTFRNSLDAVEEDIRGCETALNALLHAKGEEVERLVVQHTQELVDQHKNSHATQDSDFAVELKKMADRIVADEGAKEELAARARELEANLDELKKEVLELRTEREKTLSILKEAQSTASDTSAKLLFTDNVVAMLQGKLASSEQALQDSRAREEALAVKLQGEADELKSISAACTSYACDVELWTEHLVDVSRRVDVQMSAMSIQGFGYPSDLAISHRARLTLFFQGVEDASKQRHAGE